MAGDRSIDLSVVVVNYNVKHFAEQCLRSVMAAARGLKIEIFVVDNASGDGSVEFLSALFADVTFIANSDNLGFAAANNLALKRAQGRYLMLLNPDTLVGEDTLRALVAYMDDQPRVGAAGPKTLNRYGEFDKASKRGLPTPWVAFCRLTGLASLFPRSRMFGKYDLLYLDPDRPTEVDALTGACMIVRREAYDQVGGLDEQFFMYGEDIDWSYRLKLAGWEVHYAPVASIIHFRGESTRRSSIDRDRAFFGAMHLFVEKHFRGRYPFLAHKLIDAGILTAGGLARLRRLWRRIVWPATDFAAIYGVLVLGRWLRWGTVGLSPTVFGSLVFQTGVTVGALAGVGAYGRRRGQFGALAAGILTAFLINSSFTYFFKQFAYSRFVTGFGLVVGSAALWGWRRLLQMLRRTDSYRRFYQRPTLIVGVGEVARKAASQLRSATGMSPLPTPYRVVGFVDPDAGLVGSLIDGEPVLGGEDELGRLMESEEIEEVLFAYDRVDYNRVLQQVARFGGRRVGFKVIATPPTPPSIEGGDSSNPFLSVEYLFPRGMGRSLRRLSTLVLGR